MKIFSIQKSLSSQVYLIVVLLTLFDTFWVFPLVAPATMALIIFFLLLEFNRASKTAKINGTILIGIGVGAAFYSGQFDAILDGFVRSRMFIVMFFAVSWLQGPASESPSLNVAREVISNQPQGRRFIVTALGVHSLGAVLNLVGLSLIASMIKRVNDFNLKRSLTTALMLGFTSASCWSPFYISIVVVLLAIPSLDLLDVAPFGFVIAMSSIFVGWLYDRLKFKRLKSSSTRSVPKINLSEYLQALSLLGTLVLLVVGFMQFAEVSIPIALGLITPVFAIIWWETIAFSSDKLLGNSVEFADRVLTGLANLRNETLVFVAATVFGLGVSSLVPDNVVGETLKQILPSVELRLALLTFGIVILGMIGIHPVVTVIFIGEFVSPDVLGVNDWIMGLALLSVWGLSTIINPYSATTLYLSRVTSISPFVMAWRWNLPVCFFATALGTVFVILLERI